MDTDWTPTALITGASSGIGAAFARRLAAHGYHLVLVARREGNLSQLAAELRRQFNICADVLAADLLQSEGIERVECRIANLPALDLLVNNAGFGLPGKFAEANPDKTLAMIELHITAATRLVQVAVPDMVRRGQGGIINVASIGGFIPRPQDAVYCASKAYLIAFSQALQGELAGTGVQVQALCPGFVPTGFLDTAEYAPLQLQAQIPKWLWSPAEAVVDESLRSLKQGQVVCIPGFKNRVIVSLARSGLASLLLKVLANHVRQSGYSRA